MALREKLKWLKKTGQIKDFLYGNQWNLANDKARKIILENNIENCFMVSNPGITIVII